MENKIKALFAIVVFCAIFGGSHAGPAKDVVVVDVEVTSQRIMIPWQIKMEMLIVAVDDLIAVANEKIAIYALFQSIMRQFVDYILEVGLVYEIGVINEIIAEMQLHIVAMEEYLEQLMINRVYLSSVTAEVETVLDRQYQYQMFQLDRNLVPKIQHMIQQIRTFIATRMAHQRRLSIMLAHLKGVMRREEVAEGNMLRQEQQAIDRQRMAIEALVDLSIVNLLLREGVEIAGDYEIYNEEFIREALAVDEDFNLIHQFVILSKMAILHQKEIELGVFASVLEHINFALVNDERYRLKEVRIYDPRRIAAIRRFQHQLFVLGRKVRHFLALIGMAYYKLAVRALNIAQIAEAIGVVGTLVFAWDSFVLTDVLPTITL